jgi:hypothetical protein
LKRSVHHALTMCKIDEPVLAQRVPLPREGFGFEL